MEEDKTVMAYPHSTLQEFKEAGEAGKRQVIVTDAGLTLEGSGDWDPLLTQLYQIGVGGHKPLLTFLGYNFTCAPYFLLPETGSKEGGAGEKCRESGASCPWDPIHLPRLSLRGLSFSKMVACYRQEAYPSSAPG